MSSPRIGRLARIVGILVVVLGLTASASLGWVRFGPAPDVISSPEITPEPPDVRPTATAAPTTPVVDVPSSVDATGATDVTAQLQALIDGAPDGATIRLGADARYRIRTTLELNGRHDLTIDGRAATITLVESDLSHRRNLWLVGSTSIVVRDLTLVGSNPDPGILDEANQFEHAIWIDGGSGITIDRVTMTNPWGDCVYLGDRDGRLDWVDGLIVRNSSCHGAGRNGVSIVAGRNVRIEDSTFGNIGLHAVDIEPNQTTPVQGADRVAVTGNQVDGPIEDYFFAANGWGPVANLSVENNVLVGVPMRITIAPVEGSGYVRRSVLVTGNRSDTPAPAVEQAAMSFGRVIGLTVTGNVVPLEGDGSALVDVQDSCQVTITDNQFPGGSTQWRGSVGSCPVERP